MDFNLKINEILTNLGLTELQAQFYLALLKNGASSVSKVAQDLKINRTNSYVILERLKALDLVWEENKTQGKVIHAKSYEHILKALHEKEQQFFRHKQQVHDLIPVFNTFALAQIPSAPKIKVFESKKGLNETIDDILNSALESKEILLLSNQEAEKGFFSQAKHEEFIAQRVEKVINIRVLAVRNESGADLKNSDSEVLRETRFLPDNFSFNAEIYIYSNKIAMIDVKDEIICVVIESDELYKIHRNMFEMLWKISGL